MVTPFCSQELSPSFDSSNVKPYWKPEQPPPCTKTRRGFPSESGIVLAKYFTFSMAAFVRLSNGFLSPGEVIGVSGESRVEDIGSPLGPVTASASGLA